MVDAIFHLARISTPWRFQQHYIEPTAVTLLSNPTPSLNRAAVLLSPYVPLRFWDENMVARWVAAVSSVPYSDNVGWSVVSTLLQLASTEILRPYIPIDVWALMKKQPSLPVVCGGRDSGNDRAVVHHVRGLGDFDILKSYFLLVWSEWNALEDSGFAEMQVSIVEDLGGIEMLHHRADLIKRLDYVLRTLDLGLEYLRQYKPRFTEDSVGERKERYGRLKEALLEVDRRAVKKLTGMTLVDLVQQTH